MNSKNRTKLKKFAALWAANWETTKRFTFSSSLVSEGEEQEGETHFCINGKQVDGYFYWSGLSSFSVMEVDGKALKGFSVWQTDAERFKQLQKAGIF